MNFTSVGLALGPLLMYLNCRSFWAIGPQVLVLTEMDFRGKELLDWVEIRP